MKPKFFRKREPSNRNNPVAVKLRTAQFKPRVIRNKKKEEDAKNVPTLDDYCSLYCDWTFRLGIL